MEAGGAVGAAISTGGDGGAAAAKPRVGIGKLLPGRGGGRGRGRVCPTPCASVDETTAPTNFVERQSCASGCWAPTGRCLDFGYGFGYGMPALLTSSAMEEEQGTEDGVAQADNRCGAVGATWEAELGSDEGEVLFDCDLPAFAVEDEHTMYNAVQDGAMRGNSGDDAASNVGEAWVGAPVNNQRHCQHPHSLNSVKVSHPTLASFIKSHRVTADTVASYESSDAALDDVGTAWQDVGSAWHGGAGITGSHEGGQAGAAGNWPTHV